MIALRAQRTDPRPESTLDLSLDSLVSREYEVSSDFTLRSKYLPKHNIYHCGGNHAVFLEKFPADDRRMILKLIWYIDVESTIFQSIPTTQPSSKQRTEARTPQNHSKAPLNPGEFPRDFPTFKSATDCLYVLIDYLLDR